MREASHGRGLTGSKRPEGWGGGEQNLRIDCVAHHQARQHVPARGRKVRVSCVKMIVDAMAKMEKLLDEDCRMTLNTMQDRLLSEFQQSVSTSAIHRTLAGLPKPRCMEKPRWRAAFTAFATCLGEHVTRSDMIVYHVESNLYMYLSSSKGHSRVGRHAVVVLSLSLSPSKGGNSHILGGVSP
ncbi:hypothetical protein PybrP1_008261 [[Pythium] brassicae (nom. inval.)]|nr:hypothetical protein PybrP1_008261 [[Pythium] brassicae (nom. inval.)]